MRRMDWDSLPEGVHSAVKWQTGPVLQSQTVTGGLNCHLAAILRTPTTKVFAKGMRSDHPRAWTQHMEAMINPWVLEFSPRLLWQVETDGWHVLGFEYIEGRPANYSPGSRDLAKIVQALRLLGQVPAPDLPLKRAEQRWVDYVDDASALRLLHGDSLLHTDFNPLNILINDSAHIIDWAWPTRGAAWIDPACLIPRLIAAGHTAREAEAWAQQVPSWAFASEQAINTFANASLRIWEEIAQADPQAWKKQLASAAAQWLRHRRS